MTRFLKTRSNGLGLVSLAMVLSLGISSRPLHADEPESVFGKVFTHDSVTGSQDLPAERGSWAAENLPQSVYSESAWDLPWSLQDPEFGLRAFLDATGRVRAGVTTGNHSAEGPGAASVTLVWRGTFRRGTGPNPTFTLNRSHAQVIAENDGLDQLLDRDGELIRFGSDGEVVTPPFAELAFIVNVNRFVEIEGREFDEFLQRVFEFRADMRGLPDDLEAPLDVEPYASGVDYVVTRNGERIHPVLLTGKVTDIFNIGTFCKEFHVTLQCIDTPGDQVIGKRYDVGPYTGEIPLDELGFETGDQYSIEYVLIAKAGEDGEEQRAEAYLGDPLDVDAGPANLQTTDELVEASIVVDDDSRDPQRYETSQDSITVDQATGLAWAACPLGHSLDNAGTPDDLTDDRCILQVTTPTFTWQEALQQADAPFAGYDDWRLPNVKELQSLRIAPASLVTAVDPVVFPDSRAKRFWSATPFVRETDAASWTVEFARGETFPAPRDERHYVRLVRDAEIGPVAQRPQLRIFDSQAIEGATGEQATMIFPVQLSMPSDLPVTFDYVTAAGSADDTDFEAGNGSVTIPAGFTTTTIEVVVNGDDTAELSEQLLVRLGNVPEFVHGADRLAFGTIIDDEPIVRVPGASLSVYEPNSGEREQSVRIELDRPASAGATLNYTVDSDSASPMTDYVADSGTLVFAAGDTAATVNVRVLGDLAHENDEVLTLTLSDPVGVHLLPDVGPITIRINDNDGNDTYADINDTGTRFCANDVTTALACPVAGFPEQDAETGRDVTDADQSDGDAGFSFTKLDAAGDDVPYTTASYPCLRDETTTLVWEMKSFDTASLHNYRDLYSWSRAGGVNDGGSAGELNGGECSSGVPCDTQAYVDAVNAVALCGFTDWRLPTVAEAFDLTNLAGLVSADQSGGLDFALLPHNVSYWTGTPDAEDSTRAWSIFYESDDTAAYRADKSAAAYVRLVRGGVQLR